MIASRPAAMALMILATATAHANDDAMRDKVRSLEARVAELEAQLAGVLSMLEAERSEIPVPAAPVTSAPSRHVGIGGRIKFDAIANSRSTGAPGGTDRADTAFTPASIPLNDAGEQNQTSAGARESRLWVDAVSPTAMGDLSAYLEIDFVSFDRSGNERVSNSYNPRLRHAYAKLGAFTAGQTYTTFLNVLAYPELNDANGPVGILNIRQPMLRFEHETGYGRWQLAAEQPETVVRTWNGERIAADDDRLPDLVGRIEFDTSIGTWTIAALARQLRADGLVPGRADDQFGWGVSTSGRLYVGTLDNVRFAVTSGEGIGRYVSFNGFDDAALTQTGSLDPIPVTAGFVAWQHWWNARLRSNWAIGYARARPDTSAVPATTNQAFSSSHLNLLWSPVPEATLGIEWLWGRRELANGMSGSLNRLQFTSVYKFRR